jgi:ABC-type transport system substrate-binding protein
MIIKLKRLGLSLLLIMITSISAQAKMSSLDIGIIDIPETLDTSKVSSATQFIVTHNIVGTLVYLGQNDRYYSHLAKEWSFDWDNKSITFELHEGLKFSNGDSLTAKDVELSFKKIILKGAAHLSFKNLLKGADKLKSIDENVEGIKVLDKNKISLYFNEFSDSLLYLFTLPDSGIVHKSQLNKDLEITNWKVTSGPFYISDKKEKELTLIKNEFSPVVDKNTISSAKLIELTTERNIANKLIAKEIDYTFITVFSDSSSLEKLISADYISKFPGSVTGIKQIMLNSSKPFLDKKENRQAILKYFYESDLDFRPIKNDQYFLKAGQYLFPHHSGRLSNKEVKEIISSYDKLKMNNKIDFDFKWVYGDFMLDEKQIGPLKKLFKDVGLKIGQIPYEDTKQWISYGKFTPFLVQTMHLNEKELHQSIDYMLKMGFFFTKEYAPKVKELNTKLIGATDKSQKQKLLEQFSKIILEDAVNIPLYYAISHAFINSKYEIKDINQYSTTPKLWNINLKK